MPKIIAVIATLDTKGQEAAFVRAEIERRGHRAVLIDPGILGEPAAPAEYGRDQVARAAGAVSAAEVAAWGDKGRALETMARGAMVLLVGLAASGQIHAALGLGGGAGTSIAAPAMRALPLGFPKLLVSTVAAGRHRFGTYVGTADLAVMHSVVDIAGLNPILRKVLANAAAAVCGMAEVEQEIVLGPKPLVLATMFGTTTPCLMRAKEILDAAGCETVLFHPNGTGGRAMEELIARGMGDAALDLSTHEIAGDLFEDLMGAPGRLEAAGSRGIPQVVGPGGVDFLVLGPPEEVPPEHRHRRQWRNTPEMTLCRLAPEELVRVAEVTAERLNRAAGPAAAVVPLGGFSFPSRRGQPLHDPEGDRAYAETLKACLDVRVGYFEVDCHINDPPYPEKAVAVLLEMMRT